MSGGIDFSELNKFAEAWQDAAGELDDFLRGFLLDMANRIITKTKPKTPVDLGSLKQTWYLGDVRGKGQSLEIDILNPMDYASYIEYGTKYIKPFQMLTVSIDEIRQQMPLRFQRQFEAFLKSKGAY